ncbi:MAG: hypothetical protein AAF546_00160 [Verrucomicrobiota bacterium]
MPPKNPIHISEIGLVTEIDDALPDSEVPRRGADYEDWLKEELRKERQKELRDLVPEEFLEPIDWNDPGVDWKAFREVMGWDRKRGMTVRGISQVGKTRAIYKALSSAYVETGIEFIALDEMQIQSKIRDASSGDKLNALGAKWKSAEVLFLDDVDKVNFSKGVTGHDALTLVFGVIKARMANRRPTILSYNCELKDIFGVGGSHYASSIVERVKQDQHWVRVLFKDLKMK